MHEGHIRTLFKLLNPTLGYVRVGSLDYKTSKYEDRFFKSVEEVLAYAKFWNGKRNLFIGRNPRDSAGIVGVSYCITFDIDPIRPKGVAATDEQHQQALSAGRDIVSQYPGGFVASSGNGCLLLYPVAQGIEDLPSYYRKEKIFIEELNTLVGGHYNVHIDTTSYSEAVVKIIGTRSTKGDSQFHRLARFILLPPPGVHPTELLNKITSLSTEPKEKSPRTFNSDPVQRIREAKESLSRLSPDYLTDYNKWLGVGMVLKEFGQAGLQMWKSWSKGASNYEEGVCETKWPTLKEEPELTLGSLKFWAGASSPVSFSGSDYFKQLLSPDSKSGTSILTGIGGIDTCLRALPKGEITTIAARSGMGKSSFCVTVAENLRRSGKRVLYFSTEMSTEYILHKFVSVSCNISTQKLIEKSISEEEITRIRTYEQELLRTPVIICDEFSPKIELVKDLVEKHHPDVVVFDHATQAGTHWELVAQFVRALKELTAQKGIVTILASMLNEPPRGSNGTVGQSVRGDIRGSQEIIFLSAIFMMLNNLYEVKTDVQPVELEIAKNRFGISGVKLEVHCEKSSGKYRD